MAVDRRHGLYAVLIDGTLIGGITEQNVNTGTEVRGEPSSGEVYNRFQSIAAQKPSASFATLAIAAALDAVGLTGSNIADLTSGLMFYAQKRAAGGTRAGASSHRKYTIKDGLILPRQLSCSHQGDATLNYDVLVVYDGVNDPILVSDSVSLPAGITDAERFTLGPVTIGSVSLPQINSFTLDFGINAETEGADSNVWDTHVSIASVQPKFTLQGIDLEWLKSTNIPLAGKAGAHANTTLYLRKRAAGGTYVADGTAEHIKFTAAGLAYVDGAMDASGQEAAECSLVMPLKYDGTNDPVVVDTTSTIA